MAFTLVLSTITLVLSRVGLSVWVTDLSVPEQADQEADHGDYLSEDQAC